jgi:Mg2+-importing ATPase
LSSAEAARRFWLETPSRNVVPGDVFRLSAGRGRAPARVARSFRSAIDADRRVAPPPRRLLPTSIAPDAATDPNASHLVFLGRSVVSGTGTGLAIATGPKTMFGDIALRLGSRVPETEFEHGLRRFSLLILRTTVVLVLCSSS